MSSDRKKTPGLSTAGALLALLVGLWLAPAAQAGCFHPALRIGTESTGSAHFEWLIASGAMTATADQAIASGPTNTANRPERLPCNGPQCSNRDDSPTPSPATISVLVDSWAWFRLILPEPTSGSRLNRPLEGRLSPLGRALAIFHPPPPQPA